MFIETHEDWEIDIPGLKQLYGDSGVRTYPIVKFSMNCYLFHVDIESYLPEEKISMGNRYLAADIEQSLALINNANANANDKVEDFSISIQTRRCDNKNDEYHISTILEVIEGEDSAGQRSYIYVCKDGKRVMDSPLASLEKELSNIKTIYIHGEKPISRSQKNEITKEL